jgi:Flp pilus assembly protein TadG
MKRRRPPGAFWRSECGTSAMEFVLVLPILLMLTIGVINASVMIYTVATLHYAAEDAARWCVIHSGCTSTTVNTYAQSRYAGPAISQTFALSTPANCGGAQVIGAGTFHLITGMGTVTAPMSATACHPLS